MFFSGLTPRAMRLYKEVRKRYPKVALMRINVTTVSDILKAIENSEREILEQKRRAKMKYLKEQARHFVPYVPQLTIKNSPNKPGSSISVLQSFTSAVQLLCSPEKSPPREFDRKNRQMTSSQSNVVASLEKRSAEFRNQNSDSSSQTASSDSRRFQNQNSESRNQNIESRNQNDSPESRPLHSSNYREDRNEVGLDEVAVKKPTVKPPASQCIDLIILSDSDEEMERNHIR